MTTNRKPIARAAARYTPKALQAFAEMQQLADVECTCPRDNKYSGDECSNCKRWWELNWVLTDELHLPVWRVMAVGVTGDYGDEEQQRLYAQLTIALQEARAHH